MLSLLPLDDFVDAPVAYMAVVGDPTSIPEITKEFQKVADAAEGKPAGAERIDRFAFYERARNAFAIVATNERRLYGNVILKKGVIRPK